MLAHLLADAVVLLHLGFILFVACGGFLALRWPKAAWVHVPAAVWGALVELAGWVCPLTPLENRLRLAAGENAYASGFIDRYIVPVVYPAGLDRELQVALGLAVIVGNLAVYGWLLLRTRRREP
ncbi:MAG TPA: DUF2784 domain-containing protein [Chondromyces sp.]|nr:DUF2784 domain-containing protein [Chondromyces sp.]